MSSNEASESENSQDSQSSDHEENNYETSSHNNSGNKVYHTKNGKRVPLEDGEIPEILKEPVFYKSNKDKKTKEPVINFNKPKDQMVLIDDTKVSELDEAEELLAKYQDPFEAWFGSDKKKKSPEPLKLEGWELQYEELFKAMRNKTDAVIPIINFSKVRNFDNICKLSTLCNAFRKYNKNTIVTCSGDFTHGGAFHETSFEGRHMFHLFDQLKVDFLTIADSDYNKHLPTRISEFKGTIILSNLKPEGQKIPNTYSYVIRTIKDKLGFENKICFLGITDLESSSNPQKEITEILDVKLEHKFDLVVALSGMDFRKHLKIDRCNLILAKSTDINLLSAQNGSTIFTSDHDLKSVAVTIVTFPKGSKEYKLQNYVIPLSQLPDDQAFLIHYKYWKDLGFGELSTKYNCQFNTIFKNPLLKNNVFLKFAIKAISRILNTGYVILDPSIYNIEFPANGSPYDLFKLFPGKHSLVKVTIPEPEILESMLCDDRIVYSKVDHSNVIITSIEVAESILSEYVPEFNAEIVGDLKSALYKGLSEY
jgi:hypothetical protein